MTALASRGGLLEIAVSIDKEASCRDNINIPVGSSLKAGINAVSGTVVDRYGAFAPSLRCSRARTKRLKTSRSR